ncbi:MAG: putative oxidoreductase [Sphingomonas bacterium]|uniref:SDR family oxidoreductase n=1 Tax=Sphingomonas bacterium TaxID=1895847 RepID=UPI00262E8A24|nr:SDR family oxidoreductase [Sphingomonas bacterium]MDB5703383.1 putative oxidoreductase [Sphingomonas bacterium]
MHHRVAIVTGAGSGIGRAVALALGEAGWSVILAGRRREALEETAALGGAAMRAVPCDVTDPLSVDALFDAAVQAFGRVDLLFNNAGVSAPAVPLDELDVDRIRALLDINLLGSLLCARAAMRAMKRQSPQGGRIINNGSISADRPRPHSAPYTTSKHAITGLTKSIALDGRAYGIAAGQIDIGNAVTDMSAVQGQGAPQADGRIVAEPMMDVAHVARTVVHMASLPLEANIPFMTVMATNMPLFGRG